jgi:hypothetical protein
MSVMSECFGCHKVFTYNADRVPSIRHNGVKEPICQNCVDLVNPRRIDNGLKPIEVLPGAYEPEEVN